MSKNKTSKNYFPNNLRFITEHFVLKFIHKHRRSLLIGFTAILIILAISGVSIDLYRNYKVNQELMQERNKIEDQITFWQSVSGKYPNYRDGYFELALLNYRLKKLDKTQEYLNKALKVDPNFKEGRDLEQKLN